MPVIQRGGVIEGHAELRQGVRKRVDRLRTLRTGYNIVADLLDQHVRAQFDTQGRRGSRTTWRRLSDRTVLARVRRWGYYRGRRAAGATPSTALLWRGQLRRSFRKGQPHHVRQVTAQGLRWGSEHPVVGFHTGIRPIIAFRSQAQQRAIMWTPMVQYVGGEAPSRIRSRALQAMR